MGMFFHSSDAPAERASDPEVRRANLKRIGPLFAPYKLRLGGVLLLIVASAGLGVVPAFLLKRLLEAIGRNDTTSLSFSAGGIIAIAVVTGALGVVQTLLSNQVGQRVMHDLRTAVYRHLQRLSLAFFTRTRTGEVQSRLANDIGGVQEALSVSGILLGKTMGRTAELAQRFESESGRLADLEVRSRMTGRWMMSSIQTTFAVMPALVYLFAGHFTGSVSIGT